MPETSKTKDQAQADQRRDELAKRVLKMPPAPKHDAKKAEGGSRSRRPPASDEDDE